MTLLSYLLFYPVMLGIAVWTARLCHRHGRVWMLRIFHGDARFVDAVNNVLLVGCYTVNIGYLALVMVTWETILDWPQLIAVLSHRIAVILFSLALLHYTNITVLLLWSRNVRASRKLPFPEKSNT